MRARYINKPASAEVDHLSLQSISIYLWNCVSDSTKFNKTQRDSIKLLSWLLDCGIKPYIFFYSILIINNYWMRLTNALYIEREKWKSFLCFFIDGNQHKARKFDMITLTNRAPRSYITWLPVTLTWHNLQLDDVSGADFKKFTLRFLPTRKEVVSWIAIVIMAMFKVASIADVTSVLSVQASDCTPNKMHASYDKHHKLTSPSVLLYVWQNYVCYLCFGEYLRMKALFMLMVRSLHLIGVQSWTEQKEFQVIWNWK